MNKPAFALIAASFMATPAFAFDFSSTLVFPTTQTATQPRPQLDTRATGSIKKDGKVAQAVRKDVRTPVATEAQD